MENQRAIWGETRDLEMTLIGETETASVTNFAGDMETAAWTHPSTISQNSGEALPRFPAWTCGSLVVST